MTQRRPIAIASDGGLEELRADELPLGLPAQVQIHIGKDTPASKQKPTQHWIRRQIAVRTGALSGLHSRQTLMSLRNLGPGPIQILKMGIGVVCTQAFEKSAQLEFGVMIARHFVSEDTGGLYVDLRGSNNALDDSGGTRYRHVDLKLHSGEPITPGRRIPDDLPMAVQGTWAPARATGVLLPVSHDNLLNYSTAEPLTIKYDQGLVLLTGMSTPASSALDVCITLLYREPRQETNSHD